MVVVVQVVVHAHHPMNKLDHDHEEACLNPIEYAESALIQWQLSVLCFFGSQSSLRSGLPR